MADKKRRTRYKGRRTRHADGKQNRRAAALAPESGVSQTSREKTAVELAPWIAATLSALAAIGGLWTAWETRVGANVARETAALETQVALVRSCDLFSAARFRDGDDIEVLNGADEKNPDYESTIEREDFDKFRPQKVHSYLRCEFTNYSRVPLLTVFVYLGLDYHHRRVHKVEHNFPFSALGPDKSRVLWIVNKSREPVTVSTPQRARYARFPELSVFHDQKSYRPFRIIGFSEAIKSRKTTSTSR
jgi:hypothetical protein